MAKYANLNDEEKHQLVIEEVERFNKLIEGHKRLLMAIGEL